ncbi:class I SAM-dependent methyltransferase [Daejeonella lutea]|uniref:Methyltransferase domain-containing protein n=1 Tax=Daejeonella lutea TaxID=572036 RepID=A0A1T5ADA3_9SPHI|nr:class I SAM-dependent methyltransferase [Daejeonella lutea]SKB32954.1 Methyltransferase domain-containing protein [Daejeonella lutea]
MDVFGNALFDYLKNDKPGKLWLHNNYGSPEDMPIEVFFRTEEDLSDLEVYALTSCKGRVLDIGAGVGAHSLILQASGFEVTALEISALACEIMKMRGVKSIINEDIFSSQRSYDTLLLLMNGLGICGDIDGLNKLLPHLKKMLNKDGQIILDSSDISYLYNTSNFPIQQYFGEISYQYEYNSIKGEWFKWLYIDFDRLKSISHSHGFLCEHLLEDDMDQYLARLTIIK